MAELLDHDPIDVVTELAIEPDVIGALATGVVIQPLLTKTRKVLANEKAEPIAARIAPDLALDLFRDGREQRWQALADERHDALDRCHLCHLAEIGSAWQVSAMSVDGCSECRRHVYRARSIVHGQTKGLEIRGECDSRAASGVRS